MQSFITVGKRKRRFVIRSESGKIVVEGGDPFVERFFHRFRFFILQHLRPNVLQFAVQLSHAALHFILIALHFKHELRLVFARLCFERIDFPAQIAERFCRIGALLAHAPFGIFDHLFVHGLQAPKYFFRARLVHIERFVGFRLQFVDRSRKSSLLFFHVYGIRLKIREQ